MPLDIGRFLLYLCSRNFKTMMIMTRGKSICSVLKAIRTQVAEANEIKYEPRECHHKGECRGTCPACEAEVRYIERQLDIRRQLGKAVAIVGISAGLSALSGCGNKTKKVEENELASLAEGRVMVKSPEQVVGDVEYQSPVDTAIIEERTDTAKIRTAKFITKQNGVAEREPQAKEAGVTQGNDGCYEVLGDAKSWRIPDPLMTTGETVIEPEPPAVGEAPQALMGDVVETMPSFPGGTEALFKYLSENVHWPEELAESCVQGRVILTFVVERDGSLTDINVVKSVDPYLDKEAVRAVRMMPKWTPGMQNGEAVRVKYTIPVTFRLQ